MDEDIPLLIEELESKNQLVSKRARKKLVEMGERAVPVLIDELSSKDYWTRWEAIKALSEIGDPATADILVKSLEDRVFDIQWLAAIGLIKIGSRSVVPLLEALADHGDKAFSLRRGAHHVLHDLPRGRFTEILNPVLHALDDTRAYSEILSIARRALEAIKKERI